MTASDLFEHGSSWVRADFHLHTRADKEFNYNGDPNYFVSNYVSALKTADIRVGVITNHNKFDVTEFRALRKHARKNDILLLPGVELSVQDGSAGVHVLIVFSDEWIAHGQDHINPFLSSAFPGKTPQQYENENTNCVLNINTTIEQLEDRNKDFFLVFAHVEEPKGLWRELGIPRLESFASDEKFRRRVLGFQKVRTRNLSETGRLCRTKVTATMGDAYPAEVEGSDCKSIDQIGSRDGSTYVKIGELSFDAIKYALLDFKHRVRAEPVEIAHSHIESVSFTGGVLDGKTIKFSPKLNTLIGIRGSGKSSIIEAIRYVLDIPASIDQDQRYKTGLVKHVLGSGGKVTVHAKDRRGQSYDITRILHESPDVSLGGTRYPGISIRDTIIHKPIYFGQKDLSSSGREFESDLVKKLIGDELNSIAEDIEAQRHKVTEVIQRLSEVAQAQEKKKEYIDQKLDAEHRLAFYSKHGVEEKMQKQVNFDTDIRKSDQIVTFAKSLADDLVQLVEQYEDDLRNHATYSSKQNPEFFAQFFTIYKGLESALDKVRQACSEARQTEQALRHKSEELKSIKLGLKEEFAEIERALSQQFRETRQAAIRPEEFRELRTKLTHAEDMLALLTKQEAHQKSLHVELEQELAELDDLWHKEFTSIKRELDRINKEDSALKIVADYKGDKEAFVNYMKEIFRGSGIRETAYRSLAEAYPDFRAMYKELDKAAQSVGGTKPHIFEEYFMNSLSALLTWKVPNHFIIKYRGKELKEHSLGQRASALMLFVLNQGDHDVIIIDQPEDDLDNQTIYEDVIKLLRSIKQETQFIFATHNANIPVLGDAEQIIRCTYSHDTIDVKSGSIDSAGMQQEIVDIMEGGEEAFQRRKRIYEIWKP